MAGIGALAAKGRNGDTELAHVSKAERRLMRAWQGYEDVNPETGLAEYFSFKKILKGVAKAAGAIAGGIVGGPAGAAVGGALATKLTGGSWKSALGTGLLSGISAYGLQQSGIGDSMGISALGKGTDLLGRAGTGAAAAAGKGGFDIKSLLPVAAVGIGALSGGPKMPKTAAVKTGTVNEGPSWQDIKKPLDRKSKQYDDDYYRYGQDGGEYEFYDEVNPVTAKDGGKIQKFKYGGAGTREGHGTAGTGPSDKSGPVGGGGNKDKKGNVTGSTVGGMGTDSAGYGMNRSDLKVSNFGNTDVQQNARDLADKIVDQNIKTTNLSPAERAAFARSLSAMERAYADSQSDGVGGLLGGIGLGEKSPYGDDAYGFGSGQTDANWGFDAGYGLSALAGGISGLPLGTLYKGLKYAGAVPENFATIDMGSSVFGTDNTGTPTGAAQGSSGLSSWGGGQQSQPGGGIGSIGDNDRNGSQVLQALTQTFQPPPAAGGNVPPVLDNDTGQPVDPRGRQYRQASDYYSYGQGPEWQFFNEVNPVTSAATGGTIKGKGSGQSDEIPALLSDNEHVIDADVVAAIGDGSSDEGHRRIEEFKRKIRKEKRSAPIGKIPPKSKGIGAYFGRAA